MRAQITATTSALALTLALLVANPATSYADSPKADAAALPAHLFADGNTVGVRELTKDEASDVHGAQKGLGPASEGLAQSFMNGGSYHARSVRNCRTIRCSVGHGAAAAAYGTATAVAITVVAPIGHVVDTAGRIVHRSWRYWRGR